MILLNKYLHKQNFNCQILYSIKNSIIKTEYEFNLIIYLLLNEIIYNQKNIQLK